MDPNRKISVIIVGKNEEQRIRACIESVLPGLQRTPSWEILYVDNGSNDRTIEVVKGFQVQIFERKEDKSKAPYAAAYALGVDKSKGELLQFLDADCILDANWIDQACALLSDDPRIGVIGGYVEEASPHETLLGRMYANHCRSISLPGDKLRIDGPAFMVRRSCLSQAGPPDCNIGIGGAMELDLSTRIRMAGYRLIRVPQPMAIHRGPRKIKLIILFRNIRNGYRFERTLKKLRRMYPKDPYLKRLVFSELLPVIALITWLPIVAVLGVAGFMGLLFISLVFILAFGIRRKMKSDVVALALLQQLLHSIGYLGGIVRRAFKASG